MTRKLNRNCGMCKSLDTLLKSVLSNPPMPPVDRGGGNILLWIHAAVCWMQMSCSGGSETSTTGQWSKVDLQIHHEPLRETQAAVFAVVPHRCWTYCVCKTSLKYLITWSDLWEEWVTIPQSKIERQLAATKSVCKLLYLSEAGLPWN